MELPDNFERRSAIFFTIGILTAGILIGITATIVSNSISADEGQISAQEFVDSLEKSTGQELELVNVQKEHGLFKTQVKDQEDQLSTYYISTDGELLIQESGVMELNQFNRRVDAQVKFTSCLEDRNLVMYGNLSQQETQAQIEVLGGASQVSDFYVDVNNPETFKEAIQRDVERVPAFYRANSTIQGVQTIENLEEFTGCQYNAET